MAATAVNTIRTNSPEERVLEAVRFFQARDGRIPSYRVLGDKAGVSARLVPDYLRNLDKRGLISRKPARPEPSARRLALQRVRD